MLMDFETNLSNAQAVTTTTFSTRSIDLGQIGTAIGNAEAIKRDIGKGGGAPLLTQVVSDFVGCTSVEVIICTCDTSDFTTGTVYRHATSGAIPVAELVAGYRFLPQSIPSAGKLGMQRYLGIEIVVVGTAIAGAITSSAVRSVQNGW